MTCLSILRRIAGIVLLALHCAVMAAPLSPLLSDYTHTAWGTLQGAPTKILGIAQSSDGWLWLATESGLYRYDGVQFDCVQAVYGYPLASNGIFRVATGRDHSLWVSYYLGGVTVFHKDGSRTYGERDGLPPGAVFDIQTAPDGSVWLGTRAGAMRLAPGGSRFVPERAEAGLDATLVHRILFARDGTQWVLAESGVFFRKKDERRFTRATRKTFVSATEGPDGTIWAMRDGDQYQRLRAVPAGARDDLHAELTAIGMGFDRDGAMWLLNRNDVERRGAADGPSRAAQRLTRAQGLSGSFPQPFFQDREGNIWIGTSEGLDRFRRNRLHPAAISDTLLYPSLIPRPDGRLWISSYAEGIFQADAAGAWARIAGDRFTASYQAADGTFWMAGDQGLRREGPGGAVTTIAPPEGLRNHEPNAVIQAPSGAVWMSVSGNGGLFRLHDGRWTRNGGATGFPPTAAFSMALDEHGTVWMGHAGNAISLLDDAQDGVAVRRLDARAGLQLGNVLSLYPDGQHMWAGGERGVMLYHAGRFIPLHGVRGESFRGIAGIVRMPDGDLWLHGVDGLYRIGASSVAAWMRDPTRPVDFDRFDAQDGLRGQAPQLRPFPSLRLDRSGKLWIATGSAVTVADPKAIYRNTLAPPVVLRQLVANDKLYDVENGTLSELPEGTRSLRFTFTALSLSIPERVRFRYRLVGLDRDWQTPIERRAVSYTNLAPGRYRFEVAAANEDGVWSAESADVDIDIRPAFVQTRWFILLLAVAGAMLLYVAYRLRVGVIRRTLQARHQAQLEERARIARSLHDTLLQSVQGVMLSFEGHVHDVPAASPERARLRDTLRLAQAVVDDGRDQIMGLRGETPAGDLHMALLPYGRDAAQYAGFAFDVRTIGPMHQLRPHVLDEMYAIGREAIFNAARHAQARHLLLELEYGDRAFKLRVRDDGRGLPPARHGANDRRGHWGLRGMRERARDMGAGLVVTSEPGEGTEVAVTLAAGLAYETVPTSGTMLSRWWRRATQQEQPS